MTIRPFLPSALAVLLLTACGGGDSGGPVEVVAIGPQPKLAASDGDAASTPSAILDLSVAQGLVAFDASGQVEPGLAERWIVSDDGLSYIFRLRDTEWRPGRPIKAAELARLLRRKLSPNAGHRLARSFHAVDAVIAVTDDILEIRLKQPRPQFLALLAQPELTLHSAMRGGGPFRMAEQQGTAFLLAPITDPESPATAQARYPVRLRAGRAAVAVVRYDRGQADLVLGGGYADLPYARVINPPGAQLRFDPVPGLFGLGVVNQEGFLATAENREAVSMAIDRQAIVRAFDIPGWNPVNAIVPARLDLAAEPAQPEWLPVDREQRVAIARARVAAWRGNNAAFPRLRIALPAGAGSRILFARLAIDLGQIGIIAERVAFDAAADLRLIDEVAPHDSATWYLTRLSCARRLPCGETGDAALTASRDAPSLAERSVKLSQADSAYAVNVPFIPIASPVRWSLVRSRLQGFKPNARAVHPLNHLLKD
ncbi:ABC transporter substrate-binding protein [Sphingomonas cavernae]|uniref:ABC transporter substrate-binding protein n=1 Tax=Sphingomonas cavernae TaxID=2320861 RepID=UPI0015FFE1BE|nr:ABC transporter substrate-binding protein [Sphingomonas cavernae]